MNPYIVIGAGAGLFIVLAYLVGYGIGYGQAMRNATNMLDRTFPSRRL